MVWFHFYKTCYKVYSKHIGKIFNILEVCKSHLGEFVTENVFFISIPLKAHILFGAYIILNTNANTNADKIPVV